MPTDPPWKKLERRCRAIFGGVRLWRPDFGESIPDGESEHFTWDAKCYQKHAAISLYVENEAKYRSYTAGRIFALVLFAREHPRAGDFVLLRARDFTYLIELAGKYGVNGKP